MNRNIQYFFCTLILLAIVSCNTAIEKPEVTTIAPTVTTTSDWLEIKGVNNNGDSISLQHTNAKYVLLDFWASWCRPCRQFNPELTAVYQKYNQKGFEIFSVSLDSDESKWKEAILTDKLTWKYHYSDLKEWDSPIARHYNIEYIPYNILYDSVGNELFTNVEGKRLDFILDSLTKN